MRQAGNFHVSRFVKADTPAPQKAVYFLRLAPLGTRFVAGTVGLLPHSQAVMSPGRTYTLAQSAEDAAAERNAADLAGEVAA